VWEALLPFIDRDGKPPRLYGVSTFGSLAVMTTARRWTPWTGLALVIAVACGGEEEGAVQEEGGRGGEAGVQEEGGRGGEGGGEAGEGGEGGGEPQEDLIGSDVTIAIATPTEGTAITGIVTVPYLRPDSRALLVNVSIDWDGDGEIAAYSAGDEMQEEWVVQNVPIVVPAMTITTVPVADMSPMECGHGCVDEFLPEDVDVLCCRPAM